VEFHWKITSRTGEIYEGEDNFPTPEQKDSANSFDLFLSSDNTIHAPYGQNILGKSISLSVPAEHILSFKRRVRVDFCNGIESRSHTYLISFEKVN
jgi:hypothetical protein